VEEVRGMVLIKKGGEKKGPGDQKKVDAIAIDPSKRMTRDLQAAVR